MFRRFAATLLALLSLFAAAPLSAPAAVPREMALLPQTAGDVVMILPFENTSGQREFNWVGESFADSLADLLGSHGLRVVPSDARELAYQRLRLPLTVIPSRANRSATPRPRPSVAPVIRTVSERSDNEHDDHDHRRGDRDVDERPERLRL